jgi:uncharacterized protein (TIGR03437 family)
LVLLVGASATIHAQTTPDPFVTQITNSSRESFAGDISGNGRFVVIESTGDIATEKTTARNNADGNREIFLLDYAQRRIFQITNTTSARVDTSKPAIDFTTAATSNDFSNIKVEVSNNKPTISNNGRWLAFNSNASTPDNFDGDANSAALVADGNQEIFLYFIPATMPVVLSNGADPSPFVDLTTVGGGIFTQVTNTAASRPPVPGRAASTTQAAATPFVAFDNRDAAVSDNASVLAFVSTRNLVGTSNQDGNPEIFMYRRLPAAMSQLTVTGSTTAPSFIFNENPSLSGDGSVVAFISNANISAGGSTNNADGNAEVYLGSFDSGTAASAVTRQVTRTTPPFSGVGVNFLSPGRRLSRDGNLIALESLADLSGDNSIKANTTVFIYNVAGNSFTQVGPRASNSSAFRFPTFTDYNASLQPATIIFSSGLNFTTAGGVPATTAEGLNPGGATQIFAAPVAAPTTFTRLTNIPAPSFFPGPSIQPFASNTQERIAFSMGATELGGLNPDGLSEAFYLLSRQGTDAAGATVSFVTGATDRAVVASPTAPAVAGLSAGMLAKIRSATALAPSSQMADSASESTRRPSLPIELNGVSVSINNAAAGLFFVSSGEIQFVVPPGLAATTGTSTYPVVINNNGTTIRTTIQILPAQPDLFTVITIFGTNRASAVNATTQTQEPFSVTTSGAATKLSFLLTGVRRITDPTQVTVRIGTTDIVGTATAATSPIVIMPTDTPGTDQIIVTLPASLAGAGDVTVIVTITTGGQTFTSRPADTAPRIRIN